jgi:hypothetical protein
MSARTTKSQHKLLHALVAVGAALTGGSMVACSAGDVPLAADAGKDAAMDGDYARITPYQGIMAYGRIMAISAEAGMHDAKAATDADTGDSGDPNDAAPMPDADYGRISPGCPTTTYPCR